MRKEVIISGFGGQGVMLAGALLCYVGMKSGKEVTFFPSYGAEMRGGTANCRVIVSEGIIGSPVFVNPDILISMNRPSFEKFEGRIKDRGIAFVNSSLFSPEENPERAYEIVRVPANKIAEESGAILTANMVMLGALSKKTGIVSIDTLLKAIPEALPGKKNLWEANKKALNEGFISID
ncbi:MAG: 2-oxoacid:acceptor oxidoreductase family protein [Elusimicrobiota bacterium]